MVYPLQFSECAVYIYAGKKQSLENPLYNDLPMADIDREAAAATAAAGGDGGGGGGGGGGEGGHPTENNYTLVQNEGATIMIYPQVNDRHASTIQSWLERESMHAIWSHASCLREIRKTHQLCYSTSSKAMHAFRAR